MKLRVWETKSLFHCLKTNMLRKIRFEHSILWLQNKHSLSTMTVIENAVNSTSGFSFIKSLYILLVWIAPSNQFHHLSFHNRDLRQNFSLSLSFLHTTWIFYQDRLLKTQYLTWYSWFPEEMFTVLTDTAWQQPVRADHQPSRLRHKLIEWQRWYRPAEIYLLSVFHWNW